MIRSLLLIFLAPGFLSASPLVLNDEAPGLVTPTLETRLRYEYADQEGFEPAHATTWRTRAGIHLNKGRALEAFFEYEGTVVADQDAYRAPGNTLSNRSFVPDPESSELNRAWLSWTDPGDIWNLKVGRQAIALDNQRYLSPAKWRQNMQTFDAVTVGWRPSEDLEIFYGSIWQANRVFGSEVELAPRTDFKGTSHLFNAKLKDLPIGTLTGYVYALDLHNEAGDRNSNTSIGAILEGTVGASDLTYRAEVAHQMDAFENPVDYSANYGHGTLSTFLTETISLSGGLEYLGSDNGVGYNFPLATKHAFNGNADAFGNTPAGGLTDAYLGLRKQLSKSADLGLYYHSFRDDGFDTPFGREFDIIYRKSFENGVSLLAQGAWLDGENGIPDTTRCAFLVEYIY